MKKIKVAVIGCGRIAGHHCKNIYENPNLELAAVCDLDLSKAEKYGNEFSAPAYINYRDMLLKQPDIDMVAIITPSGMHYEHALEIIEKFKKHIIIEKPTFLKLTHLKNIYQVARAHHLNVFPVFQNRYNKAVQRVKTAIQNQEMGIPQIFSVRVRWCRPQRYYDLSPWRGTFAMDGGALTNQGVHHVDLLRYLGGDIQSVNAKMATYGANIEVEDTCVAQYQFSSGAMGTLEVTTAARPDDFEASISILGTKGLMQIGGIAVNELQIFRKSEAPENFHEAEELKNYSEDFSKCVYGNGHESLYQDIVAHMREESIFPVSETEAFKTLSLLHSFYVSHEQGVAVNPVLGRESSRLGEENEKLSQLYRIK